MKPWFTGLFFPFKHWHKHIFHARGGRHAGKNIRQANRLHSQLAELTSPATSVVSAPWVSFSLSGCTCLACGFSCLFSPQGTLSVPGCGRSATRRFGRGRQSDTLLFFSLSVSRSDLVCPGNGFSIRPLWAEQRGQEEEVWYLEVKMEIGSKVKDAHLNKQMYKWTCRQANGDKEDTERKRVIWIEWLMMRKDI